MIFHHEIHSLRVVDKLATRMSNEKTSQYRGLNLTFEVRDGIVSHCGERYNEYCLTRDTTKGMSTLEDLKGIQKQPYTLEACIVRLVDKIAYVGRDIEDAVRVNLMSFDDISPEIKNVLGFTNGEIINTLVKDVVENSYGKDMITLSEEKGKALEALIKENMRLIYKSHKINTYEKTAQNMMEALFTSLIEAVGDIERLEFNNQKVFRHFYKFIKDMNYGEDTDDAQKVVDFIAGMTDGFAVRCFEELYWL